MIVQIGPNWRSKTFIVLHLTSQVATVPF